MENVFTTMTEQKFTKSTYHDFVFDTDFWNENVLSIKNDYDLIEIYSRTNSIGLPIEYYNEDTILKTNVKELFANGWFQTNEHTNLYYISPYMKNITVKSDGKITLNAST